MSTVGERVWSARSAAADAYGTGYRDPPDPPPYDEDGEGESDRPGFDDDELVLRFTFQKLRPGQADRFDAVWAGALEYARLLRRVCPASAELDAAVHALEGVVYEANASIARRR